MAYEEIVVGPLTAYFSPLLANTAIALTGTGVAVKSADDRTGPPAISSGAAFKAAGFLELIDDATTGVVGWIQIGKSGAVNYQEDGVSVAFRQSLSKVRGAGATAPIKIYRTEEDVEFSLMMRDLRIEMFSYILNLNKPSTPTKSMEINILQDVDVIQGSVLLRGLGRSPYAPAGTNPVHSQWALQFYLPLCACASDETSLQFGKNNPSELNLKFTGLYDASGRTRASKTDAPVDLAEIEKLGWVEARMTQ